VRPLRDGVISQYEITFRMIQHFIKRACGGSVIFKPRVIICVPSGITEVEERSVVDAATQAGAKRTYLIEEPVAAAIGAGIDISAPNGHMVVDIGGGTTDIAVLSLGGVVVSESIKVAGDKFDEAIIRYVRRKHNVLIGERTAEEIKIKIGSAWPREEPRYLDVKGRCLIQGLPRVVRIHSHEIPNALEEPLTAVIEAICSVIERTPPELIGDILSNGIVMTGGGSLLYGLDRLINYATDIRTRVAARPIQCVAIGTGKSLDNISHIPEGSINISRMRV
jgi:rod shape-determining protein MreB